MTAGELMVMIGLDNSDFNRGMDEASSKAGGFGGIMKTAALGVAAGTAAVAAAGAALLAFASRTSAAADEIDKTSIKLGISTDALQEMDFWASQNGISQGTLERAVGRLNQRIGMAAEGNDKYADAFGVLGIAIQDTEGNLRDTEDVLAETISKLSAIEDPAIRSARAAEIFGTSTARQLMPALQEGSLSMEEAAEKAHELGLVMSKESIDANVKFQDSMDAVKRSIEAGFMQVMTEILPILQAFLDWIMEHMPMIQATIGAVMGFISNIVEAAFSIFETHVLPLLNELFEWVQDNMPQIQSEFNSRFNKIREIVESFVTLVMVLWERFGGVIMTVVVTAFEFIWHTIEDLLDVILGIVNFFIGVFTGDWELMRESLEEIWDALWNTIKRVVETAWTLLRGAFGALFTNIKGWFMDLAVSAFEWGQSMISSFIEGIRSMFGALRDTARSMQEVVEDYSGYMSPTRKGPGRFVEQWGANMVKGFMSGMEMALPELEGVMAGMFPSVAMTAGTQAGAEATGATQNITQTINIHANNGATASDLARKTKQASRALAMEWQVG